MLVLLRYLCTPKTRKGERSFIWVRMCAGNECLCARVHVHVSSRLYSISQETILSGNITDSLTAGEGNENLLVAERNWNVQVCSSSSSNIFIIKIARFYNL